MPGLPVEQLWFHSVSCARPRPMIRCGAAEWWVSADAAVCRASLAASVIMLLVRVGNRIARPVTISFPDAQKAEEWRTHRP